LKRSLVARKSGATASRTAARRAVHVAPLRGRIEFIQPQLATAVDEYPSAGEWLTEIKFDGYRILAYADGDRVHCFSRSGLDWTHRMPAVARSLAGLRLHDTWLDGAPAIVSRLA
jgi:bifunctional non-homologous end joining protein LigD